MKSDSPRRKTMQLGTQRLIRLLILVTFSASFCGSLLRPVPTLGDEEVASEAQTASSADIEYFEKKVRPLLATHCYSCHSKDAKTIHGGLRLDTATALFEGGDSGAAVVPGKPDESLFISAIQHDADADIQMPPKGKLPDDVIAELTNWVSRGAPFPKVDDGESRKTEIDFAAARQFWSFRTAERRAVPATQNSQWPKRPVDHFLLAKIEEHGLQPSPQADRATLLRRLSFDLTGLPPTPEEIETFVNDTEPGAYEKQVERLLRSPHFGERWARMWLDLARYTDKTASWLYSTGEAHLYRDWVVQAMNEDMPYDAFIHRQLATDLMSETGPDDIPALGFLGLSPNYWKELKLPTEIINVIVADEWEERVDAVSRTFLGLTVACARCHDHKFDPITTEDYYAMAGVFASSRLLERPVINDDLYAPVRQAREEVAKLEKQVVDLKKKKPQPADDIAGLEAKVAELKKTPHYESPMAAAVVEESLFVERQGKTAQDGTKLVYKPGPRDLNLFIRGNPNRLGDVVPRRFVQVLSADNSAPFSSADSGRLELARAITGESRALVARVIVNRIWAAHFGQGLVPTPSNFGQSGERPSHPELLDDLTARFVENGWSLKELHREIVLSAAYQQSSRDTEKQVADDPDNVWLSRMNRRRLDVEAWRDSMLSATGRLDLNLGGPSAPLTDAANVRRTLYGTIHRREMSTMLLMHDFPDPTAHSPKRITTTTTLQGLYALNGPMLLDNAAALSERLAREFPEDDPARITRAYQLLFNREPTARESEIALGFLAETAGDARATAWIQYSHVLLASNEFLFVD
jgi:cytochrome c553